jgi:protein O-mannosyl-transferase
MEKRDKNIRKNVPEYPNKRKSCGKFTFLCSILIFVSVFLVYSNSIDNSFQFDDVHHIHQSSQVKDIANFKSLSFWFDLYNRAPAVFTLALNYRAGELDVRGYHIVNVAIHGLASVSVFLLIGLLLNSPALREDHILKNKRAIQLFSALVFALHPIQTQSVTYIIQRMESLSGLFYILSLSGYLIFRSSSASRNKIAGSLVFVLSGILAALTKQTAFTLPLAILLLEIFFVRENNGKMNKKIISTIFILVMAALTSGINFDIVPKDGMADMNGYQYLFSQLIVIPRYIFLLIIPYGQNIDHYVPLTSGTISFQTLSGGVAIGALLWAAYYLYKKGQLILSFSIAWFFVILSLRSSIFPISDIMVEHRLYLAVAGYGLFAASLIFYIMGKAGLNYRNGVIILTIVSVLYGIGTVKRNNVWKDEVTLWTDSVLKSPEKFRPNYNAGEALKKNGMPQKALEYYLKAYEIDNTSYGLCNNIANIYAGNKDYPTAEIFYNRALELKPDYARALNNLANINYNKGNFKTAQDLYLKAIASDKYFAEPYLNLGHLYYSTAYYEDAAENYREFLKLDPGNETAANNLRAAEIKALETKGTK